MEKKIRGEENRQALIIALLEHLHALTCTHYAAFVAFGRELAACNATQPGRELSKLGAIAA